MNHEEIGKDPQIILKIKPSVNKYNLKEINYPWIKDDCKKIEQNNPATVFNVLYDKTFIYIVPTFQNRTSIIKKYSFVYWLQTQKRWHYLAEKTYA